MSSKDRAYILGQGEGEAYWFAGALMTMKANSEQTGNRFALLEQLVPPEYETPFHTHRDEDEAWYILDGAATFYCGTSRFQAAAGAWVFLPRAVSHAFRAESSGARLLTLTAPAGFADFVQAAGEKAKYADIPPPAPLDIENLARVAAQYGIEIVGPPPPAS